MVALNNIRNRLRAVTNIKQITTSMEMVSSARLKKAQEKAKKAQFYVARLREILERLEESTTEWRHPLFEKRRASKKAFIIVSSDRGLCGAYNTKIFSAAEHYLEETSELILLGRKAIQYYKNQKWPIRHEWLGWGGKATYLEIQAFTEILLQGFLEKKWDEVWLIYTQFHHLMSRDVIIEKFLPIGKLPHEKKQTTINYLFEPDLKSIYEELLPRYCTTKIETMIDQAYAAELAARIFAMKAASQNAEEMVEELILTRNKVRQSNITRELLEMSVSQMEIK